MGGIGPHLGEIWGFENFTFGHIWPQISRNPLFRISPFSPCSKTFSPSRDPENWKKIATHNFEKSAIKVGEYWIFSKTSVFGGDYLGTPEVRTSKFCSSRQKFMPVPDVRKITKIDSTEVSRFRRQSARKIRIAEIGVRGTTFDSPYLGRQCRYSRNFTAFDSSPKCLQSDQKSLV